MVPEMDFVAAVSETVAAAAAVVVAGVLAPSSHAAVACDSCSCRLQLEIAGLAPAGIDHDLAESRTERAPVAGEPAMPRLLNGCLGRDRFAGCSAVG